jgi:hypothetical protein
MTATQGKHHALCSCRDQEDAPRVIDFIHIDVTEKGGQVTSWDLELGSPNALMRRGWSRTALKSGDKITVSGYLAKDGSHLANARSVTLSDGKPLFAGSSFDGGPEK